MFRIESYITPIIWSYFSKYVKNFNSHDFQVSLWNGGAVFSNLELNLDVLDSELQIPLTFAGGNIQELKITVPWRKITSEPIVLNVKSMELVLKHREGGGESKPKDAEEIIPPRDAQNRDDENAGYMRGLISKIVTNVRVNFENVVIKYVESDIAFSFNVGEASLTAADENWKDAFLDRIVYSPEFILRKKLSFSDVNICLDRCNNAGVVDKFHDPMLYRCDFDVRIIQKFATTHSRIPYFYRMDLFLGHLQFCVTDEQIPMLVRLYNLFTWLMQSGSRDASEGADMDTTDSSSLNDTSNETADAVSMEQSEEKVIDVQKKMTEQDTTSWTNWAASWLYTIPGAMFGEEDEVDLEENENQAEDSTEIKIKPPTPPPLPPTPSPFTIHKNVLAGLEQSPPTTHFGIFIKTLTIIFKAVQRSCDRPPIIRRKIVNIFPFLKCSIQGICCDFILRGSENSHSLGVSSIMVHGLGFCPCGVHDCNSSAGGIPSQGGECYFEAGKIMPEFSKSSLFQPDPPEWCYDVNHKSCLNYDSESMLLNNTPAFFLKYIVTRSDMDRNDQNLQNPEINEILYHCVAAPCKVLLCSGLIHRLKMINNAINNYGYEPYGTQPVPVNITRFDQELKSPLTTYRLVIRQPLIEILAADHPVDYSAEKRAEYFRKNGGLVVPPITIPRLSPEWPKMIISCDIFEFTAVDEDNHFYRLRNRLVDEPVVVLTNGNNAKNNNKLPRQRRKSVPHGDELAKFINHKSAKEASLELLILEVLVSFVSEPVELTIGVKAGVLQLKFSYDHFYTFSDILHRNKGNIHLESVTCSTRLQQRSNVLWLPFTIKADTLFGWEPNLSSPSFAVKANIGSLTLYVGPETIIAFTQLTNKLSVYLQEFLPRAIVNSQSTEAPHRTFSTRMSNFSDSFKSDSSEKWMVTKDVTCIPESTKGFGICTPTQSVLWRYPQKRTLRAVTLDILPFSFEENHIPYLKLHLENYEELTDAFHHFFSFTMMHGKGKSVRFANDINRNAISASIWRVRISEQVEPDIASLVLDSLSKCITVESLHIPELSVMMELSEVNLNLVNNTFYAGKAICNSALQSYLNTDGVSPDDHIVAALHFKQSAVFYSTTEKVARFNADFFVDLKVLDYETLVLEEILEPIFLGVSMTLPECVGSHCLNVVTEAVNLKVGASLTHSVMYSTALWNQVMNSFDVRLSKMGPTETLSKIILNRVLVCNDLNIEIQLRSSHPESLGAEKIPSKDCKAVSFPSSRKTLGNEANCAQLYLSCCDEPDKEVEIDIYKPGYTLKQLDNNRHIFVNVSNLSKSQKLIKLSGTLILANALDQAVEISLFPYSGMAAVKTTVPSRGVGPTFLYTIDEIEHFRVRFVSSSRSGAQQLWSGIIDTKDLVKKRRHYSAITGVIEMYEESEKAISSSAIWITLATEQINGQDRYLVTVSPIYCLRSWLCGETFVHLSSAIDNITNMYSLNGKGGEIQIEFRGDPHATRHMRFQSNLNVSPTAVAVPLLAGGPQLDDMRQTRPIDELLAQITNSASHGVVLDSIFSPSKKSMSKLKWPFIDDDIPKDDWNTEINPETEIKVSFTHWIEGLPTIVADIRPWALFINLSGVELLFAQEIPTCDFEDFEDYEDFEDSEWDQFWVPYKCVFSPKPISIPEGKFRIGIMMNDFLVKSPSLQFSDQPERLTVKKINEDGRVPIDCFSRLDLFGGSQVACLTIETRIQNKILVVTVRPTYSIQNRAPFEVYAEGVTISSAVPQRRESWTDNRLSMYNTLEPLVANDNTDENAYSAVPILHFTTDGQDYSASAPSYKYLALSCGGPWWFVQLVDCSESAHSADGIPGTKTAVTLPKVDCSILSPLYRHKLRNFKVASEPVVVGSYTKNGQVWVSISQDNAPQLVLHNKSCLPLFYAEKDKNRELPRHHTSCFEQYLMIPPKSTSYFSFANAYNIFPQLNKREPLIPDLMMAEVSQDLVDLVTSHQSSSFMTTMERPRQQKHTKSSSVVSKTGIARFPTGNLLFPDFDIGWKSLYNVHSNPTQYAKFGGQSLKITVEIVGYAHHMFIENTKLREVSAMSVRSRFTSPNNIKSVEPPTANIEETDSKPPAHSGLAAGDNFSKYHRSEIEDISIIIGDDNEEDDDRPPSPTCETVPGVAYRPWKIKVFIPELYLSIKDDFDSGKKIDNEFIGLTLEPIILEQVPIIEDSKLRPTECPRRESWIYAARVGNVQIDTPSTSSQRRVEFPVLLEPVKKFTETMYSIPKSAFDIPNFLETFEIPNVLNVDSTITLTRVSSDEINMETVWLKVLPFSLYIEDRLVSYVLPSIYNIIGVFNEGYILLENCAAAKAVTRPDKESPTQSITDAGIIKKISILDSDPSFENPSFLYSGHELSGFSGGVQCHKRSFGNSSGSGSAEVLTLFSRSAAFDPPPGSSSSGLNSSNSSVTSLSMSNLRLASVSPPASMIPLEAHGVKHQPGAIKAEHFDTSSAHGAVQNHGESPDDANSDPFAINRIRVPKELLKLFVQLSRPVRVNVMDIQGSEVELTLRTEKLVYVALDRSVVQLKPFKAFTSVTTDFHLGLELTMHYTMGTIFTIGNPVRVLGSLELLGSPGTLARTVGTGLRDLVVYPYEGILNGPVGFVSGLGYGMTSLLRSVTSGTLVSLTNWAESVSRNIDRLTLDEQEQLISEAERQVELQGLGDGFVHGLSGFGIRILGAIGGLSHHPIKNVIHRGPTTSSVIGGVSRGVIGVVVKPIGGVAELISMTGQGVLLATGWKPKPKVKKSKSVLGLMRNSSESS